VGRVSLEAAVAAAEAQPPREGLRSVAALRGRIDDLEAFHVENAVRSGWSWRQVAEALGVTKQAAHKKHAKRVAARLAAEGGERKKLIVTGQARQSVKLARDEAAALGAGSLREEHLLLGLLRDENGAVVDALAAVGISLEPAREAVRELGGSDDDPLTEKRLPVAPGARAVMEQSLREAVRRGDGHLGVEHLLLALVREPDGPGARLVAKLGGEPGDLERHLDEALAAAV
jgi:Clp amino terminal domain, pathogenicity island component